MFSLLIFKWLVIIPAVILGAQFIIWVVNMIMMKLKKIDFVMFSGMWKKFNIVAIISCILAVIVFVLASVVPYMAQERDRYLIAYYSKNIVLLHDYIDEYAETARKQVEEYQKLQTEMARIATATQLQFWSKQQDEVGNALTDSIKVFKDEIRQNEIDINKAEARIQRRPKNKFFFGLD